MVTVAVTRGCPGCSHRISPGRLCRLFPLCRASPGLHANGREGTHGSSKLSETGSIPAARFSRRAKSRISSKQRVTKRVHPRVRESPARRRRARSRCARELLPYQHEHLRTGQAPNVCRSMGGGHEPVSRERGGHVRRYRSTHPHHPAGRLRSLTGNKRVTRGVSVVDTYRPGGSRASLYRAGAGLAGTAREPRRAPSKLLVRVRSPSPASLHQRDSA